MRTNHTETEPAVEQLAMGAAFLTGFVEELAKVSEREEALHAEEEGFSDELNLDPPCCVDWTKRW
ncbi:MAG: hypothetical protein AAGJ79_09880 [Verrucomicrobiota bacterium]